MLILPFRIFGEDTAAVSPLRPASRRANRPAVLSVNMVRAAYYSKPLAKSMILW